MKYLLPLILLCVLLCGCGQRKPSDEHIFPAEPVVGEASESEVMGGRIHKYPLNLQAVQGFCLFENNILLFSGGESTVLTLLDGETLEFLSSVPLTHALVPENPSLVFHPGGQVSFYDPIRKETLLLDSHLQEISRIPAPGGLSGLPVLSEDEKTLFYCTASQIRAWNLDTGIHRCVKEMAFPEQQLTGVHMGDSILQCQITDDGQPQTLFFSAEDGRLLHRGTNILSLTTTNFSYFAQISAGQYRIPVFGTSPDSPIMISPDDPTAQIFFLPKEMAAVTATSEPQGIHISHFSLPSGQNPHQLTLNTGQELLSVAHLNDDVLALLIRDSNTSQSFLILWETAEPSVQDAVCNSLPYRAADDPDAAGLAHCRYLAQMLGDRYGIRILLGDEAIVTKPRDCLLEAEHLIPILQWELSMLENRLAAFPETLLQKTAAHFSSLNLCLVRSVSGLDKIPSVQGAHFLDGKDAYLYIPTGNSRGQALYHQLFHLMEPLIYSESKALDHWEELNPAGFRYDYDYAANANRDSGVYLFEESRSFVDTFSMSYPKEDRARIMEYAMIPGKEALFQSPSMQKKLHRLCAGIREAYDLNLADEPFLWEQYLD